MLVRSAAWSFLFGTAAIVGGVYLYSVYGPRKHRAPLGLASGMLLGQHLGAVAGYALGGPVGLLPGSTLGGIAGAVLGHDLTTSDAGAAAQA